MQTFVKSRHLPLLLSFTVAILVAGESMAQVRIRLDGNEPDLTIDAKMRGDVIDGALRKLHEAYVFPDVAKKMDQAVRARLAKGEYDQITSAKAFTEKLTADLRAVSKDKHLRVNYVHDALPAPGHGGLGQPNPAAKARMQRDGALSNHGFEKCERLRGNVGYLDVRGFHSPEFAADTAAAAMNFLANTDALIIDLRQNGGGTPAMVAVLCSYFFDAYPLVHLNDLYDRQKDETAQYWTLSSLPGKRYLDKDVYLLTSKCTFSGAEEFTYNLKNLKRATLVGETTGGGAHPVSGHRINDHFIIGVPFARAVNPITKTNWEGTGVTPDVAVPADQALKVAYLAALTKQREKNTDPGHGEELKQIIETVTKELEELKKK